MKFSKKINKTIVGVAFLASQFGVVVYAAPLEEIVVVAQKRDQNLQSVPMVITSINSETIAERGLDTLADLTNVISSLQVGTAVSALQISIRGVGLGLASGVGENSVATHFDGAYMSSVTAPAMMQHDISGIEVLNGPQGTLWGRNATGGVINYKTPAPPEEFGGSVSVLGGGFDRYKISGNVGGPVSDNTRVRISLVKDTNNGHIENLSTGNDVGGNDVEGGRFSVDSDLTDNLNIALRTYYYQEESQTMVFQVDDPNAFLFPAVLGNLIPVFPEGGPALSVIDPRKAALGDGDPWREQKLFGSSLTVTYNISDNVQLKSISSYVDYELDSDFDADGTLVGASRILRPSNQETITQELNLLGSTERVDWLVGYFYMKDTPTQEISVPVEIFGINNNFFMSEEITSHAIFTDATYSLTDNLRVFGGLRYLQEDRDQARTVIAGGVDQCAGGSPKDFSIDDTATTGRLGLQFDINPDVMLYAQYATGWKSGGLEFINCLGPTQGGAFEPEELASIEIGVKATLLDGRMRINTALFDYDFEAFQFEETTEVGTSDVSNVDTSIRGLEMDVLFAATDSLEFSLAVTLLDTEYDDFITNDQLRPELGLFNIKGTELNRTPDWRITLGAQYSVLLENAELRFRGEMIASDEYRLRPYPYAAGALDLDLQQGGYEIYNIYATFLPSSEQWKLNAFVKNLTDEDDIKNSAYEGATHFAAYRMPRTWGVELTWNF